MKLPQWDMHEVKLYSTAIHTQVQTTAQIKAYHYCINAWCCTKHSYNLHIGGGGSEQNFTCRHYITNIRIGLLQLLVLVCTELFDSTYLYITCKTPFQVQLVNSGILSIDISYCHWMATIYVHFSAKTKKKLSCTKSALSCHALESKSLLGYSAKTLSVK